MKKILILLTAFTLGCETSKDENVAKDGEEFYSTKKNGEQEAIRAGVELFLVKHCDVNNLPVHKLSFFDAFDRKRYEVFIGANNNILDVFAIFRDLPNEIKTIYRGNPDSYVYFFCPSNNLESLEGRYIVFTPDEAFGIALLIIEKKYSDALDLIQKKRCRDGFLPVLAKKIWDDW